VLTIAVWMCAVLCCAALRCALQVDKSLNVVEFHEKPPRRLLATMSIDTLDYGFGGWGDVSVGRACAILGGW
jgi:hypothetical protein